MDRFHHSKSLWASWVAKEVLPDSIAESSEKSVFFAGDTGYRSVLDGQNEDEVPVCEAFKQIGELFPNLDLAMIPVGYVFSLEILRLCVLTPRQCLQPPEVHVTHSLFSAGCCLAIQGHQSKTRHWNPLGVRDLCVPMISA
jgi:hypothetical protein